MPEQVFIYVVRHFSIEQTARVLQLIFAAGTSLFPIDGEEADVRVGASMRLCAIHDHPSALPDASAKTGWGRCVRRSCLRCSNPGRDQP
jgi:hypothetical protein